MYKPSVILLGSKPGATVALELMLQYGWQVRAVVPSGGNVHDFIAGQRVEELATKNGIPLMRQTDLPSEPVDFVISYMFRNLVKSRTLQLARRSALNFHAGPLPEYGGWAFYNLAILENAPDYGCTCHHMDEHFDTGPLLQVNRFAIKAQQETAWSLERKAQEEMIRLFVDFLHLAESGRELPRIAQDKSQMRYLDKGSFEELKKIPEHADEETIQRYARAFFYPPYECAYLCVGDTKVEVLPKIAKQMLAERLHYDDLDRMRDMAQSHAKRNVRNPS
jgi:methionyl-tRNA formyltransferase